MDGGGLRKEFFELLVRRTTHNTLVHNRSQPLLRPRHKTPHNHCPCPWSVNGRSASCPDRNTACSPCPPRRAYSGSARRPWRARRSGCWSGSSSAWRSTTGERGFEQLIACGLCVLCAFFGLVVCSPGKLVTALGNGRKLPLLQRHSSDFQISSSYPPMRIRSRIRVSAASSWTSASRSPFSRSCWDFRLGCRTWTRWSRAWRSRSRSCSSGRRVVPTVPTLPEGYSRPTGKIHQ